MIGASKIARDITERLRAEKEHARLMAREPAARAQVEEANRATDEFLATASYQLRTPLNSILGRSGALVDDLESPMGGPMSLLIPATIISMVGR